MSRRWRRVFRRFAGGYLEAYGAAMLPSHRRAIADILACRTEALGGQQWGCPDCGALLHVFHSCRNRACPTCHGAQTRAWLEQRRAEMLPVPYFHVTVTVPEELRAVLRRHQIDGYGALMKAAAGAIIDLARDPRWVGGTPGVLAVLHTWTQQLISTPRPLSGHRRRPFRCRRRLASRREEFPVSDQGPRKHGPHPLPRRVQPSFVWTSACRATPGAPLGRPYHALAPRERRCSIIFARYAFRIAITDRRIGRVADTVTFRYKDRAANRHRTETLPGEEFIRRFLQHVLPAGFHKVRYYGLWHPPGVTRSRDLENALLLDQPATTQAARSDADPPGHEHDADSAPQPRRCPHCQTGHLRLLRRLSRAWPRGP